MRLRHLIIASSCVAWGSVLLPSCLEPTQIMVDIRTDVKCPAKGMIVRAGKPSTIATRAPDVTTMECYPDGHIGSVNFTPKDDDLGEIAIRAVIGVDVDVAKCGTPENGMKGCSEQKRIIAYSENTPLTLPIDLYFICIGVLCSESETCNIRGQCVSARVNADDCVPPKRCYPAGDEGLPPGPVQDPDASTDVTTADGQADGTSPDGTSPDGSTDGSTDGTSTDGTSTDGTTTDVTTDTTVDAPKDAIAVDDVVVVPGLDGGLDILDAGKGMGQK